MFSRFSNLVVGKRIQKLLKKNQIEVLQFEPGRMHLKSPLWKTDGSKWGQLCKELEQDAQITSVTYAQKQGTLLILFNPKLMEDYAQIELLLKKVDRYTG